MIHRKIDFEKDREYEEKEEIEENKEQGKENPERNVIASVHPRINKNYVRL